MAGFKADYALKDGEFWYPDLGWANYTLQQQTRAASAWAETLIAGDIKAAEYHRDRLIALCNAFLQQMNGEDY